MTTARPRLAVGVLGAGRVGSVLGAAPGGDPGGSDDCVPGGCESRARMRRLLPDAPVLPPDEVVRRSQLLLIAVPDDVLPGLVEGLAAAGGFPAGQLVMHPSGRYGVGVLRAAAEAGALPLALHPVMTFTGSSMDLPRLAGCTFGVTATDVLRPVAETLVLEMGGEPAWVAEESRALYHAALAHGANHLVTLVNETADLLRAAGVDAPARMLGPLLGAALDNALRSGDAALTGPVARGDAASVAAHLAAIAAQSPHLVGAYVALARATADRALAAGILDAASAAALLDVLAYPDGASA